MAACGGALAVGWVELFAKPIACTPAWRARDGFRSARPILLLHILEIAQVGGLLALLDRHQVAIGAEVVALLADDDVLIVLAAFVLIEDHLLLRHPQVALVDRPGPGQG